MQGSFDDLGMPLDQVTFCVVDIETTGGTAADGGITEIGAARYRGGECLGTFQTFVNPGFGIPHQITMLTGITTSMVAAAPPVDAVLPTFLEFVGDAVIVGHNVRYDLGYLNAALERSGRPKFANGSVDTLGLARRLVRDEVPNCKLSTLAQRLHLAHQPCHRALDDVLATADLLHLLLERAGRLGVLGLDDLIALPKVGAHPQAAKLKLTDSLPRKPGVYLFRSQAGDTLYVGKATNLRTRVRSYFSSDDRRKVGQLLKQTARIDHVVCPTPLEAAVLEVRLIHRLEPAFNRQLKTWRRYVYLKVGQDRLSIVKTTRADDALYLGPLPSHRTAKQVVAAIETALPFTRDTAATVRRALLEDPALLLDPIDERMQALAAAERFEDAAEVRDRAAALTSAIRRQRRFDALRRTGRMVLEVDGISGVELDHGRLVRAWTVTRNGITPLPLPADLEPASADPDLPVPTALADELTCVATWLDSNAHRVRVVHADSAFTSVGPDLPSYEAR
ncbi:MAG: DEDD exonuclease domain-containing protein [Aquihabitans sp.]